MSKPTWTIAWISLAFVCISHSYAEEQKNNADAEAFKSKCSRCHNVVGDWNYTDEQWKKIIADHGDIVKVEDGELNDVKAYIASLPPAEKAEKAPQKEVGEVQSVKKATNLLATPPAPIPEGYVTLGDQAPNFSTETVAGEKVTLSEWRGKNTVLLLFIRANW